MNAIKDKLPKKSNPINVFGCVKCSVLYVQYDNILEMVCPACESKIDMFCTYRYLAFSGDLLAQIPGADKIKVYE